MANLGKPFKSLPLSKGSHDFASESAEGTRGLLASMAIRSAPLPGTGARATPLPELAQQIAEAEIEYPESALRRLHTYAHVKKALGSVPNLEEEKQTFIGRLATRLKTTFYGKGARRSDSRDQASAEKKRLLGLFHERTGGRNLVHLPSFQVAMKIKGEDFAERLFKALDCEKAGYITDEQLVDALLALKNGTFEEKIAFIWSFVAEQQDCITFKELQLLLKASFCEGQIRVDDLAIERLAAAFFAKAWKVSDDKLSLADFTQVLQTRPEIRQSLQFGNLEADAKKAVRKDVNSLSLLERTQSQVLLAFQVENVQLTGWLLLVILGELAGFIVGFLQNRHNEAFGVLGWSYPVAKGAARSIQVVTILFPFTMARSLLTFLRLTPLHHILPLDEHLNMHRHLGYHFFFWGLVHSVAHFINGSRIADPARHHSSNQPKLVSEPKWYREETQVTGVMLMAILCVCYLFAVPAIRKSWLVAKMRAAKVLNNFEAFYVTHIFMAVSVLVLLIIHPLPGPALHNRPHRSTTWAYLAGGSCVYILERIARVLRQVLWNTSIVGVKLHQGPVTELRLRKPRLSTGGFKVFPGKAGQYCFLNIPELSRFEWHPFSLTSGPNDDYISFHIRAAGDWTKTLHKRCEKTMTPDASEPSKPEVNGKEEGGPVPALCILSPDMRVYVDGPFGAPAQDHSHFDCLLLVGAGIGITPFASVLRQILDDYNRALCECCKTVNPKLYLPKKVYFYWMTREQSAPQFFKSTLEDLMRLDTSRFLEINIYLTRAVPQDDLRITIGKVAQVIQHEKDGYDALAGTYQPAPCFFGYPTWPSVFKKVSKANPGARCGVFYCGPPGLAAQLKGVCKTFNQASEEEELLGSRQCEFFFHKENF